MKTIQWIVANFGVLVLYQLVNYFFDLKVAIVASVIFAVVEVAWQKLTKRPMSLFMWISVFVVVIFGVIDLYLESVFFMKLESGLLSLVLACFFGSSLFREKSIVEELAEQQGRIEVEKNPDKTFFFRLITSVWFGYYFLKAIIFTWLNFNSTVSDSFVIRTIVGTASFYILLAASIGLSRPLWRLLLKLKLMPSSRSN